MIGLSDERVRHILIVLSAAPHASSKLEDASSQKQGKPRTIVLGGGFGGTGCALELLRSGKVHVTLIDRNNYHQFQPLLYQLATSQLATPDVAFSLRDIFRRRANIDIKLGEVVAINAATRTVSLSDGQSYSGEYLVLACGAGVNFFGTPGAAENAFPLYTLSDAERLRSRILNLFEDTVRDPQLLQQGSLDFVIVGAGATGVELAGAMSGMIRNTLPAEYPELPSGRARVYIVERGATLLAQFGAGAHDYAYNILQRYGVEFRFNTSVTEVHPDRVQLSDGTHINTHCTIWAAGLHGSAVAGTAGLPTSRAGQIQAEADLSVEGYSNVFAVGDVASIPGADKRRLPQLGSVAKQSGTWTAKNILADVDGAPRKPFHYIDRGIMAMIGKDAAIAEVGSNHHELTGAMAYAMWLGVHLALLSGLQVKIDTFVEWLWFNFNSERGAQIIDRPDAARIDWHGEAPMETPAPA